MAPAKAGAIFLAEPCGPAFFVLKFRLNYIFHTVSIIKNIPSVPKMCSFLAVAVLKYIS